LRKRTKYEIYFDMLESVRRKGKISITKLSYSVQMPVDRTKRVVNLLVSKGLLKEENIGDKKFYRLTERGGALLEALRTVRKFMN